jgi:hypothetical protein
MNYLERYRNGEYERVWDELQSLGSTVRQEPYYSLARGVATETMRRVRHNCDLIIPRLRALGHVFDAYPDGSSYYTQGARAPRVPPSEADLADIAELEERVGLIPLSLVAFWQEVGTVDLVGMHPSWPEGLDPLVVYPPEVAISDLDDWEARVEEGEEDGAGRFEVGLAPDELHKDNVSGGAPYSVALPDSSADFMLLYEPNKLLFVPYLRLAILRWGGFPGYDAQKAPFQELGGLVAGLEPF